MCPLRYFETPLRLRYAVLVLVTPNPSLHVMGEAGWVASSRRGHDDLAFQSSRGRKGEGKGKGGGGWGHDTVAYLHLLHTCVTLLTPFYRTLYLPKNAKQTEREREDSEGGQKADEGAIEDPVMCLV